MLNQQPSLIARTSIGLAALLVTSASWGQQDPAAGSRKEAAESVPAQESPLRQPPTTTGVDGKSVPATTEKLVLADPASKMYMPCRDPNDSKSTDDDSKGIKPNPKAAVLTEEAAKQHGYKPSPHKVVCPKQ
jgi:hypothetical protein